MKRKLISVLTASVILTSSILFSQPSATSNSRKYIKYTYETNTTTEYYLTQSSDAVQSRTTGIIEDDDRFRDGNDGIVHLSTGGTGFIVDDHVIATAAHCISNFTNSSLATSHYFIPDLEIHTYDSNGIYTTVDLTPVEAHVPYNRQSTVLVTKQKNDYALITVEEDLSEYTHFNLGHAYDTSSTGIPVFATGFPLEVDGGLNDNQTPLMYTGYGVTTTRSYADDDLLYFTVDTTGGNSGGPIYTITDYTVGNQSYSVYTAISLSGIASTQMNWGPRFTPPIIQFYLSNPNIGY